MLLIIVQHFYKNNFNNSIFVITKNERNNKINYYEINDRENKRTVSKFNSKEIETFEISGNCYESYIDRNKVLNKLNLDNCEITNSPKDKIELNGYLEKIVYLVSKVEHDIIGSTVLKLNDDYYVVIELNVNWWSPYKFYKYYKNSNKLKLIYTFDGGRCYWSQT